jgi:hypothetical protein
LIAVDFSDGIGKTGRLKNPVSARAARTDETLRKFVIILAYPYKGQHQIYFADRFGKDL